jgi:transcriptional regulator with XRE-family HTH domain
MSTVLRNKRAGELIRDLRSDRGLSPEALSYAIFKAGHGAISARTIRRVEAAGMVPRVRAQFAIASYFERPVSSIWSAATNRKVAA